MSGSQKSFLRGYLKTIVSVLDSLKEVLLLLSHWTSIFSSGFFTDSMVSRFLLGNRRLVSSAELCIILLEKTLCKSLIYTRNNKRTWVDPCGTPHKIFFTSEEYPRICTYCFRFVRKDRNQLLTYPRAP